MPADQTDHLPNCRLFLVPPSGLDASAIVACVGAAAQAGDVACLVLPPDRELIGKVMPQAQDMDIAVLVADDARVAAYEKADGVHVTTSRADAEAARKSLGQRASVGFVASGSRHAAMEAGESAIDYIAFDLSNEAGRDLLEWWTPLFEVPCVGLNAADEAACEAAIEAGADFIMPPAAMWESAEAARDIAASLTAAGRRNEP
jgi:thiamine-phosphate pyrophosphorylase